MCNFKWQWRHDNKTLQFRHILQEGDRVSIHHHHHHHHHHIYLYTVKTSGYIQYPKMLQTIEITVIAPTKMNVQINK